MCPNQSAAVKRSTNARHVLVVDDDHALLRLVSQWLSSGGFSVVACNSFEDAKRELTVHPPDVLLTDLRLGAFNGLQLVILANEQEPHPLTIVMSAYDDPTLKEEAERCGARYLQKPFSSQAVISSLTSVM
jgi:DNA-binding NtrC family response regulator